MTHDKRCPLFVYSLRAPTDLRDGAGMTAVTSSLAGWTEGFVRLVCTRCDVGPSCWWCVDLGPRSRLTHHFVWP